MHRFPKKAHARSSTRRASLLSRKEELLTVQIRCRVSSCCGVTRLLDFTAPSDTLGHSDPGLSSGMGLQCARTDRLIPAMALGKARKTRHKTPTG